MSFVVCYGGTYVCVQVVCGCMWDCGCVRVLGLSDGQLVR